METDDLSGFDSYRIEWEAPCRIRSEDKRRKGRKGIGFPKYGDETRAFKQFTFLSASAFSYKCML